MYVKEKLHSLCHDVVDVFAVLHVHMHIVNNVKH